MKHQLHIVAAPLDADPPFPVHATAEEDDTFRVLSAEPSARPITAAPARLLREAAQTDPLVPGTVVVERGRPLRLLAIVHDLNEEPSWREEWITAALVAILREAEARALDSIALPLLGTVHGSLAPQRFIELLVDVLESTTFGHLQRIWLVTRRTTPREALSQLAGYDPQVLEDG